MNTRSALCFVYGLRFTGLPEFQELLVGDGDNLGFPIRLNDDLITVLGNGSDE